MEETGGGDIKLIAGSARKRIEQETKKDLSAWQGPKVTTNNIDHYKIEWRPIDNEENREKAGFEDACLTIYDDGVWELYALDGKFYEGGMMRPHDKRWIRRLVKEGYLVGLAKSSWMYYKLLVTP